VLPPSRQRQLPPHDQVESKPPTVRRLTKVESFTIDNARKTEFRSRRQSPNRADFPTKSRGAPKKACKFADFMHHLAADSNLSAVRQPDLCYSGGSWIDDAMVARIFRNRPAPFSFADPLGGPPRWSLSFRRGKSLWRRLRPECGLIVGEM
jgi:hypothetical protein